MILGYFLYLENQNFLFLFMFSFLFQYKMKINAGNVFSGNCGKWFSLRIVPIFVKFE